MDKETFDRAAALFKAAEKYEGAVTNCEQWLASPVTHADSRKAIFGQMPLLTPDMRETICKTILADLRAQALKARAGLLLL